MIGYIKGTVEGILSDSLLVENNGMGYKVFTSGMVLTGVVGLHEPVKLFTHLHVREDELSLFGFPTVEELEAFEMLISVNGIGPKAALSVLSVLSVRDLALAIMSGDAKVITKANGIGSKGANRIIMELKDKLKLDDVFDVDAGDSLIASGVIDEGQNDSIGDAVLALVSLGYSEFDALKAVKKVPKAETMEADDLLKKALKFM